MTTKQTIAERAYQLWNARGRPHGSAEGDWLEAERQLSSPEEAGAESVGSDNSIDASLEETFPRATHRQVTYRMWCRRMPKTNGMRRSKLEPRRRGTKARVKRRNFGSRHFV